jgi:hypothetical protein
MRHVSCSRLCHVFAVIIASCLVSACGNLLPQKHERPELPWNSFEDMKHVYDLVLPHTSTVDYLHEQEINPYKTPNISIVSHLDIQQRFIPNAAVRTEDVAPEILECIRHAARCYGYALSVEVEKTERVGNLALDLMNFRKTTETTGWRFDALFVIDQSSGQDTVVYKVWRGDPQIYTTEKKKNPLGPFNKGDVRDLAKGL